MEKKWIYFKSHLFVIKEILKLAFLMDFVFANHHQIKGTTGCEKDPSCMKCGLDGCMKCPHLITIDHRRCVEECGRGYIEQWSIMPEFIGRICRPTNKLSPIFSVIGITLGALFCCGFIVIMLYIRRRRRIRNLMRSKLFEENEERIQFLRQLNELRPNALKFLAILNDSRRQIRKLHLSGDSISVAAYRPIVCDLAKILILLNRPVDASPPPNDWNRLHTWAQRVLRRYKPQTHPLMFDFFDIPTSISTDSRLASCQHHTFKSTATNSTNTSDSANIPMQTFGSLISFQQESDRQLLERGNANNRHSLNFNSLWMEDEFFKLGHRPQDEITTEL